MTEYVGQITRSEVDETGNPVAKRLPWTESDTTYGGVGTSGIKRRIRPPATVEPDPIIRRSPAEVAAQTAQMFVNHLTAKEIALGRPLTTDDLTQEETRAFGVDLWIAMGGDLKRGIPDVEFFRQVAGLYIEAGKRGAGRDPNWTPSGMGFNRPKPEQWKEPTDG